MAWSTADEALEYYHACRAKLIEFMGGRCVECGTTEDLHFDHVDPATKSFPIQGTMSPDNPRHRAELDKCQLLCRPHHEAKTARERTGFTHGTTTGWMKKKCDCDACATAKRAWHDARNAARRVNNGRGPYDKGPAICGTLRGYKKGCKCRPCKGANAEYARNFRRGLDKNGKSRATVVGM